MGKTNLPFEVMHPVILSYLPNPQPVSPHLIQMNGCRLHVGWLKLKSLSLTIIWNHRRPEVCKRHKKQHSHPDSLVLNYGGFFPHPFCKEFLDPIHKLLFLTQLH